ncbi:MAG: DNA translocase FtsK, partial [Clostridia bacterium]|nr:DNA translocase FtsK [Clostridia bacterium]
SSLKNQLIIVAFVIAAILLIVFMVLTNTSYKSDSHSGPIGFYLCRAIYGFMGSAAYLLPLVLIYLAVIWHRSKKNHTTLAKIISAICFVILVSSICYLATRSGLTNKIAAEHNLDSTPTEVVLFRYFKDVWNYSKMPQSSLNKLVSGGGILGALFGGILYWALAWVSWIIVIFALIASFMVIAELSPAKIVRFFRNLKNKISASIEKSKKNKETREKEKQKELEEKERQKSERPTNLIFPVDNTPQENDVPITIYNKKQKSVGISPLEYDNVAANATAADPKITETIPPVLKGGKTADSEKESKEKAEENSRELLDILFPNKDDEPDEGAIEPITVSYDEGNTSETAEANLSFGPKKPEAKDKNTKKSNEKTTAEQFAEITDLQDSDENDHALTDPDYSEEEIKKDPFENYEFPPISLLKSDPNANTKDFSEELQANGVKLINALESFKVKAKITHISRGPTITRYEVLPDQGVRVRAIANLVDDIALNMETSGVRIEAPIPGKAAVGIEVPNQERETVFLKDLIDSPKFSQATSKVTAALGTDVAGDPIFMDLAKMPHLLIAGTTGSGKSVCINSIIVSLLYHAKPDEVKLILIDPKKVELGVYGSLPHLLVPVVTNPKKAAGSLTWAVTEMERRYVLFEDAEVRDIAGYNRYAAENDLEKLPTIIIVIDELADLMFTAPDTVEESVIRLAQKARAAGMHLVVGTQRPSVDVITGLIKANIPSRIAFTVVSNVDSRTIIDIAGAEKLCGRGDMLFSPIGAMKPIRVQGAFVSEQEVEAVCNFIKKETGGANYSQETIDQIREHEADCEEANKKKGAFGQMASNDDEEADPKFHEAVKVAIESGKISTSLLQRRLQLGYGRAAKIIDKMEEMGFVSPPDGQKPRNVLITMPEYQEMMMQMSDQK